MRIRILFLLIALTSSLSAKFYHWSSLPTTCNNVTTSVCPSGYTDNGSNCKKTVAYKFYEYKCSDAQNSQDYNYIAQDEGLSSCSKTDPNTSTVNSSTLDDACNSSTPPTNNCKREKFTCVADSNRPCAKVDNKWQCSPFACNNDLQCGYATCNGLPTSNTAIMPYEYHPIEALTRSGDTCIPIQCDADYEYSNGTATKVDKKLCDGEVVNGKCVEYEYASKIESCSSYSWAIYGPNLACKNTWYTRYGCNGYDPYFYYGNAICNNQWDQNFYNWFKTDRQDENGQYIYECRGNNGSGNGAWLGQTIGKNLCTNTVKTCPSGYSEYGSTTQCRKEKDIGFKEYYYHTYKCPTDTNAFGETWTLTEPNIERGCLDDTFGGCLNFDIETQRCKRKIHTCPNGSGTCTLDGNNKYTCSYDGCDAVRYPCIGQMCDLALNDRISFCENESCPSGFGVYEENNKCYIDQCPSSAPFEGDDGNCYEE